MLLFGQLMKKYIQKTPNLLIFICIKITIHDDSRYLEFSFPIYGILPGNIQLSDFGTSNYGRYVSKSEHGTFHINFMGL